MINRYTVLLLVICFSLTVPIQEADAITNNPGSCLIFPYYNTHDPGSMAIFTITNTGHEDIWVRLVWIASNDGIPRDTWIELARNDTFTFLDQAMVFGNTRGFIYVYAVEDESSSNEIDADVLLGQEIIIWASGEISDCLSLNALTFEAIDLVQDGELHLDGKEYEAAPRTVYFPRFFGQNEIFQSHVLFIGLTGGRYYHTAVDILIYNDQGYPFTSWVLISNLCPILELKELSVATTNEFLLKSKHDLDEPVGFSGVVETGSLRLTGIDAIHKKHPTKIEHASIYAFLFERVGSLGYVADLPMQTEDPDYTNAVLWLNPL